MPKVTVYIREEDYPRWKAIEKKTAFISSALGGEAIPPIIKENSPIKDSFKNNPKLCKHGSPKGQCFNKESHRLKCNA